MSRIGERIMRLFPKAIAGADFACYEGAIERWNLSLGPQPTEAELLAVDLSQPSPEEVSLQAAKNILRDDIPAAWRTSANAQQRIPWAIKRLLIEMRREVGS